MQSFPLQGETEPTDEELRANILRCWSGILRAIGENGKIKVAIRDCGFDREDYPENATDGELMQAVDDLIEKKKSEIIDTLVERVNVIESLNLGKQIESALIDTCARILSETDEY